MKRIKHFQKIGSKAADLGVKFAAGGCMCDHDTCATGCIADIRWCMIQGYGTVAWKGSGRVDGAIEAVPIE